MKQPRLFAEVPAGLASVSLALQGGKHCKPPLSRMGSKAGYAFPILDAMGLRPGLGAQAYLWCEADDDVRALLCAYPQPALLRAVAEVLRGWKDEEPRALWTRLREERKARKAAEPADRSVAEWMFLHHGSYSGKDIEGGIGAPEGIVGRMSFGGVRPSRDIVEDAALRLSRGPGWPPVAVTAKAPSAAEIAAWLAVMVRSGLGGSGYKSPEHGPGNFENPSELPRRVAALSGTAFPPVAVTSAPPNAAALAEWAMIAASNRLIHVSGLDLRNTGRGGTTFGGAEFATPAAEVAAGVERLAEWVTHHAWDMRGSYRGPGHGGSDTNIPASLPSLAGKMDRLGGVTSRSTAPTVAADLEGCIILMDPPYRGTTGYGHDMPREDVVRLARSYAEAGAFVVVCEAEPVDDLTTLGWDAINIGGERRGQKRTFGATEEWLTTSRPPVNRPAIQAPLFAVRS